MYKPFCADVFFLFKKCFILYWCIADEQGCDSFRWITKGLSHTCIYSPLNSPTIWGHVFSFLLSTLILCLNFWGSQAIFQSSHFTFLPVTYENSSFSTFSSILVIFCVFFNTHISGWNLKNHYPYSSEAMAVLTKTAEKSIQLILYWLN